MRTENYLKQGVVSILLVFALVFSMITISAPLASAFTVVYNPGGAILENVQGGTVTIKHTLEFDEPESGAYTITMSWLNYDNKPEENLTFVSATAYYTTGPNTGEYQQCDVINWGQSAAGDNTRWTLAVGRPADNKDPINENFDVDIVLGLWGVGGVPHIPTDNHPIEEHPQGITWVEKYTGFAFRDSITIKVIGAGVTVDIVPASDNGWTGENLTYDVTVTNTGELADTYNLSADDTLGWTLDVTPGTLSIPASGSDTATLTVTVGAGTDTITVTAVGDYASDSDTCTATQTEGYNVDVSISPLWDEALPGDTLYYEVVIKNTGTEPDNYDIAISETETWGPHFSPDIIQFAPIDDAGANEIGIPFDYDVPLCGQDVGGGLGTAIVYSKYDLAGNIPAGATDIQATLCFIVSDSFIGNGGTLSIGEVSDDSWTEETMTWETKPDLGSVITASSYDPEYYGWLFANVTPYIISEFGGDGIASLWMTSLEDVHVVETPSKEFMWPVEERPYLEVTYEPPAEPPTVTTKPATNVTDTQATLNADFTVGDSASVNVWFQYRVQGEGTWIETTPATYTASGSHSDDATGLSYETTYEFRAALQYGETIYGDTLIFETSTGYIPPAIQPGENITKILTVEIPLDAVPRTTNYITVTATSQCDPTVSDSDTCQAYVEAAVEVDVLPIDPQWQEQHANKPLQYFVTIVNEGAALDNFDLVLSDTLGWNPTWDITTQVLPTDDGNVTEAFPDDPPRDAGSYYNMYNGWSATYLSQRPYLKFDVSSIPTGSVIKSATLWACSKYGPSTGVDPYPDTYHLVDAMSVDDDDWDETTITWHNAPPVGDVLDTENFQSEVFIGLYHWYSWDVTDFVANEMLVNQLASIALKRQDPEDAYPSAGWFYTKDAGYNEPYLEITYMPGVDDSIQITLDNGESVTLGFGVIVPADAIPSVDTDVITVTATSQTDGSVTDSESAEAHAGLMRGVEAWIEGLTSQETYKDPLTYVIRIHNAGQIADKYTLIAYDTQGWPLYVEPQEIYLKPSHTAQAALSVTIPYQTPGTTTDDITVVIEGNLASGTFSDPVNVSTSVNVQAIAEEVYGVDLEVYPSIHQTGHPNSRLTWLVTVTNTGNMPDTYDLSLSQYVWDRTSRSPYPIWSPGLDESFVELGQGEEASILLNLDVPADLRTGVHNEIDVEAISRTDSENIRDIASVTAQVLEQKPRIPQGEIQLQATAGIVAIDIWETYYDFGVFNEMDIKDTSGLIEPNYFTVRNVGNVNVEVWIQGTDATSKPGEPAAKWTLGDGSVGVDMYAMWRIPENETVTKTAKTLVSQLEPSEETSFDLMVQAPSTFTTPAKMWMKVAITARKIHY